MWPKMQWHYWLEKQIKSLCENDQVSWAGCGASGKTYAATLFALVWWLAKPDKTAILLTSTTAKMIRKRMWANLQTLLQTMAVGVQYNMVDSKMTLQAIKGDDRHSISAIAVADGNTQKAVANIQGIHAERVMVIIDEATDTPEAAFEACTNLRKGCKRFKLLVIGNPASKFDPHGRLSEPKAGWRSVGIQDQEWDTKNGVCLRFDGVVSPNILEGKDKWPFIITSKQVAEAREQEGEESPTFWKFTRGFWAPDGMVKTVLSESIVETHDLRKRILFESESSRIAALDPAFGGGDRCILRFGRYGKTIHGNLALMFDEVVHISPNANLDIPVHYQIADKVISECKSRGIPSERLGIDATGEGGGLADIIEFKWGKIHRVEFGGSPDDIPVSDQDARSCRDVYDRKVSQLWFTMRKWAMRDKIGGLDVDTLKELCSRLFNDEKRKIAVESKTDMKGRTRRSPDLADAAVIMVDVARRLFPDDKPIGKAERSWESIATDFNNVYNPDNMYQEA